MKIKRFEAANMTDALKLIKQEFGDDAVILSAKSMRKSTGLLGGKQSEKVVVTAAVDTPLMTDAQLPVGKQNQSGKASPTKEDKDRPATNGKLNFFKRFNPITRTGQQKLQSKFVQMASTSQEMEGSTTVKQQLMSQGVSAANAKDLSDQAAALLGDEQSNNETIINALSNVIGAQKIVKSEGSFEKEPPRIVVLVGPSGVGKTTMTAKLAAMQARKSPASTAILSLDDHRVAGCAELERYAKILNIRLFTACHPDEVASLFNTLCGFQMVVVDTPALSPEDNHLRQNLKEMIAALPGAEVHLLLNADSKDSSLIRQIAFFEDIGLQFLGFTKLDWADAFGSIINQAMNFNLPIGFLSDNPKANKGVQQTTASLLAELIVTGTSESNSGLVPNPAMSDVREDRRQSRPVYYVANSNSDIFHKYDCKSVKRINRDNMLEFDDPAEALGQKYKPCRMCCSELLVSKPIQRVAYKYASSR